MNCMKCGRETQEGNVFCQECLTEMEKYPVRPGTVVQLSRRRETVLPKKVVKRHVPTPEEQIKFLRKWAIIASVLVALCVAIIALMFEPTMHYVMDDHYEIGQNYSSVSPTTTPPTPSSGE